MTLTPSTFAAALTTALPGAALELGGGKYGKLSLSKRQGLTFKSDGSAVFDTINVASSSGIHFDGVAVAMVFVDGVTKHNTPAVRFTVCDKVSFNNGNVKGPIALTGVQPTAAALDASGNVIGYPSGTGITFDRCTDSEAIGNDISQAERGISFNGVTGLRISRNDIHDLRKDPISGQFNSALSITENHLWGMKPWGWGRTDGSGDHGDFIHIFTATSQTGNSTGLSILNNLLEQDGGVAILGAYIDSNGIQQIFDGGVFSGNVIINDNGQGVRAEDCLNFDFVGNFLFATSPLTDIKAQPRLTIYNKASGQRSGNRAADLTWNVAVAGWHDLVAASNQLGATKAGEADAARTAWLAKYRTPPAPEQPETIEITLKAGQTLIVRN